jgi:site-specific DNA-cytosine methylase
VERKFLGINVETYIVIENDRKSMAILEAFQRKHLPSLKIINLGDINHVEPNKEDIFSEIHSKYGRIDLIIAGSPCQDWSKLNVCKFCPKC